MQPESSDGFASVGTILPRERAALLPGGSFLLRVTVTFFGHDAEGAPGPGSPRTGLGPWGGAPPRLGTGDFTKLTLPKHIVFFTIALKTLRVGPRRGRTPRLRSSRTRGYSMNRRGRGCG